MGGSRKNKKDIGNCFEFETASMHYYEAGKYANRRGQALKKSSLQWF